MVSSKIGIIDYGMGNVQSIVNALNEIGFPTCLVSDPQKINSYDKIILPGVGASNCILLGQPFTQPR